MLIKQRKTLPKERSNVLLAPLPAYMEHPCCLALQDRAWILLEVTQEDRMV